MAAVARRPTGWLSRRALSLGSRALPAVYVVAQHRPTLADK